MNNTVGPGGPAPIESGPSTIETIIGLLALILALAAVVIAIIQVHQARAIRNRHRPDNPELGHANIELTNTTDHVADTDSVGSQSG